MLSSGLKISKFTRVTDLKLLRFTLHSTGGKGDNFILHFLLVLFLIAWNPGGKEGFYLSKTALQTT